MPPAIMSAAHGVFIALMSAAHVYNDSACASYGFEQRWLRTFYLYSLPLKTPTTSLDQCFSGSLPPCLRNNVVKKNFKKKFTGKIRNSYVYRFENLNRNCLGFFHTQKKIYICS